MPNLPKTAFTLQGGCYCASIRYTIAVPALASRPSIYYPANTNQIGTRNEVTERLPLITQEHCKACTKITGAPVQSYINIAWDWLTFTLLPRPGAAALNPPPPSIAILTGHPTVVKDTFVATFATSSGGVPRLFCSKCGTHLTLFDQRSQRNGPTDEAYHGTINEASAAVTVGSLDKESVEREGLRPSEVRNPEEGIPWVKTWLKDGQAALLR